MWQTDEPVLNKADVKKKKGAHQDESGNTVVTWIEGDGDNEPANYLEWCFFGTFACLACLICSPCLCFYGCSVFIVQVLCKGLFGVPSAEVHPSEETEDVEWYALSMALDCKAPDWASVMFDHSSGKVELRKGIATVTFKNPAKEVDNDLAFSSTLELSKLVRVAHGNHLAMGIAMNIFFLNKDCYKEFCCETEDGSFFVFHAAHYVAKQLLKELQRGAFASAVLELPDFEATYDEEDKWHWPSSRDGCLVVPYGSHHFRPVGDLLGKWEQCEVDLSAIRRRFGPSALPAWQLAWRHLVGHTATEQVAESGQPVKGWMWWLKRVHTSGLILSPNAIQFRTMSVSTGSAQTMTREHWTQIFLVIVETLLPPADTAWADVEQTLQQAFAGSSPVRSEADVITPGAKSMRVGPYLLGGIG